MNLDPKFLSEQSLSTIIGIALVMIIYYGGKSLWFMLKKSNQNTEETLKTDEKQLDIQKILAELASNAVAETKLTRQAFERNTEVLAENTKVLDDVRNYLKGAISELKVEVKNNAEQLEAHKVDVGQLGESLTIKLDNLADQMNGNTPVKIVVKDQSGSVLFELQAEEETVEEGGVKTVSVTLIDKTEEVKPSEEKLE